MSGKKNTQLSAREQRFVSEYVLHGNASQAYRSAGYTGKQAGSNALKLMQRKVIKDAITAQRRDLQAQDGNVKLSRDYLLLQLKDIAENSDEKTTDRLKALELMGKSIGMFVDKVDQRLMTAVKYYSPEKRDDL